MTPISFDSANDLADQTHAARPGYPLSPSAEQTCIPDSMIVAVDTEFHETHTLTAQFAFRRQNAVVAQIYRSPEVPDLPATDDLATAILGAPDSPYREFISQIDLRRTRVIEAIFSPAQLIADALNLVGCQPRSRAEGEQRLEPDARSRPANAYLHEQSRRWRVPSVKLTIVGHFLPADFGRIFGAGFYRELLGLGRGGSDVVLASGKTPGFANARATYAIAAPIVQYLEDGGNLYGIALEFRDTSRLFGPGSLDAHSRTFLGLGKDEGISSAEKANMLRTFRARTADAYRYAVIDVLNTLLVFEQMTAKDHSIYRLFGHPPDDIPPMANGLGRRVSQFIVKRSWQAAPALGQRGLKQLMRRGSATSVAAVSRFGDQTPTVHGGLLFSRSPTKLWHRAPGMLRDVDMCGCYNNILNHLDVYWGKPVVFEPGRRAINLRQAVALAQQHADRDAWYVRVTGDIADIDNVLIPSTLRAITRGTYRRRTRRITPVNSKEDSGAKLFSRRIESGVVTWATWLMIQALPAEARRDYEQLSVDSLVLYPRALAAHDASVYQQLVAEAHNDGLPWSAELDLDDGRCIKVTEHIDQEYVSLRFPLRLIARELGRLREEAQRRDGKGSGMDRALKEQINTIYGVLTSRHMPTSNAVAANQITAAGRALAFAMMLSLNGIQVITDGCTYRRDHIPACTLAECLEAMPDYALRHADEGARIPFVDPGSIPNDDQGFTAWHRDHVKHFLGDRGDQLDDLLSWHPLEHKKTGTTGSVAFDALGCSGVGNYIKCTADDPDEYQVHDMAMRGYRPESQGILKDWIVRTFSEDRIVDLPPLAEDGVLLKLEEAKRQASQSLSAGTPEVYLPLGLKQHRVRNLKVVSASAFVFQTPRQRARVTRQLDDFARRNDCGLELLALRRHYGDRPQGSIERLLELIYGLILDGRADLNQALNLGRLSDDLQLLVLLRQNDLKFRRAECRNALTHLIDARTAAPAARRTGIILTAADQPLVKQPQRQVL